VGFVTLNAMTSLRLRILSFLALVLTPAAGLYGQNNNDVTNEWRITAFPHYPIKGKMSGFGYLGWVTNPDSNYKLYYFGVPGFIYTANPKVQAWVGLLDIYTNNDTLSNGKQDTLELRPFIGGKFFLPNKLRWNIYNFSRLEFRQTYHHDTHDWTNAERLRLRFGIEAPLTSREKAWTDKTFYGIANVEPLYRFDKSDIDPFRAQLGLGYVANDRIRAELLYYANWGRVAPSNDLAFTENIIRLNIKIGVKRALLSHVWNPE
jgi:hypothetical protein